MKRLFLSALCLLTLSASADAVNTNADEQVSDALIRSAIGTLAFTQSLESDEPAIISAALLDAALELNPKNAQAWAMRAELAESAGEQEAYERALVGYLDTGVDDDLARFNLIRYRLLSQNNTLDDQLRDLEKLLNSDAGRGMSGPLRSRLASLASSTANELLDEGARRKWAVQAARADPANLEGAQTMLDLVIELGGDDVRQGTATVNVIRADPLAPGPRLDLAARLAEHAAFDRAAQQYQVVSTRLSPEPLLLSDYASWAHCLAMTGQDELLLQLLDEFEAALNQAPPPAGDAEPDPEAEPAQEAAQPVELPFSLALIRLAVLRDSDDPDRAQLQFDQIARQLQAKPEADEERLATDLAKQSLARIAAVFAPDLGQAEQIARDNGGDPVAQGWIALRRGDAAQALELLRPHTGGNPLAACGFALASGQDDAGRARLLQGYIESESSTSLAALAAGRALINLQKPAQPNTTGQALLALMAKYPESFWLVDVERTPWIDVRMRIKPQRIKPLQPIKAEITVWNTSRFPLAITENGPINPSMVVTLNASSAGRQLPPYPPVVVDLSGPMTIEAGERIILDTRLDYHQFGLLRANNPGAPMSFDARLIVNPILTPTGLWRPNGIGGLSDVRDSLVEARPATEAAIQGWLADIDSRQASTKLNAIRNLAYLDRDSQPDLLGAAVLQEATQKMLAAWDSGSDSERAWMLLNCVELEKASTTYTDLLERATNSNAKIVWYALLTTHAKEAGSELFLKAIGRQDLPEVSRFAERMKRLLRDVEAFVAEQEARQAEQEAAEGQ
ncbi:MAG: hypothetical protein AAGI37_05665 [Planctomycetota bacterium]